MTRPPTEMELRVAKALWDSCPDNSFADGGVLLARAAIRAMREPTAEMEQVGITAEYDAEHGGTPIEDYRATHVWKQMIDSASPPEVDG